jgi:hypothetical protein
MKRFIFLLALVVLAGCGSGGGSSAPILHRGFNIRMLDAGGRPDNHTVGSYTVLVQGGSFEHPGGDIFLKSEPTVLWTSGNDSIITATPLNVRVRLYDSLDATGPILQEFNGTLTVPATNAQNPDGSFSYELELKSHGNLF